MELFGPFVPKEIHRRNWLEALEFYRGLVLQALVEVLRMQYGPLHYDFRHALALSRVAAGDPATP